MGSAKIADALLQRNLEALERLQLKPGDGVVHTREHVTFLKRETVTIETAYVVSSVKPDGRVYFKGGQGKMSNASQLRKLDKDEEFVAGLYEGLWRRDLRRGFRHP